ncbi:hypothetical protein [Nocardia africana]|uniref:Uncharacterized protein n=1 Tax=Nocardia africana TaxID=134964 RepID=A0ABW6NBG0_9NOCA
MTDYAAEMDRILADYRAGSHGIREQFLEADARTTRGGADLFAELREQLRENESQHPEASRDATGREDSAEREQWQREAAERANVATDRRRPKTSGRDAVVLPSDWTDEDEARAEGYGPPESWLR